MDIGEVKLKKLGLLVALLSMGIYFYLDKETPKKPLVIKEVSPNHVFFSLEEKTKSKPDKSQYSVENLSENFRVVKFYYTKESLESLAEVQEATEYKVFYQNKLVLRFDLIKKRNGKKDVKIIKKENPHLWSEEFNNLLQ